MLPRCSTRLATTAASIRAPLQERYMFAARTDAGGQSAVISAATGRLLNPNIHRVRLRRSGEIDRCWFIYPSAICSGKFGPDRPRADMP